MNLTHKQEQTIKHELRLHQVVRLILTARIMQLPNQDLKKSLDEEASVNPLLQVHDPEKQPQEKDEQNYTENWEAWFRQDDIPKQDREIIPEHWQPDRMAEDSPDSRFLNAMNLEMTDDELSVAEVLFEFLDQHYFFAGDTQEFADKLGVRDYFIEDVFFKMQRIEPYGIGSRNAGEYCLIQLQMLEKRNQLAELVAKQFYKDSIKGIYKNIYKHTKADIVEVKEAVRLIRAMHRYPSVNMEYTRDIRYVKPDAKIEKEGEIYKVVLLNNDIPDIRVNTALFKHLRRNGKLPPDIKKHLEKLKYRAEQITKALVLRRERLQKALETMVEKQRDFLEQGEFYLKPLIAKKLAALVGCEHSVMCRLLKQKYILTHQGKTLACKDFLCRGFFGRNGEELSPPKMKKMLADLIAQENKQRPWSDRILSEKLGKLELVIGLRTVNKYREELHIPNSRDRKE
ncbi:hypothetical protein K8S19_09290 [bacterium]|nr:hypothetical protein [bacterium]